jgi:hypothetical protein
MSVWRRASMTPHSLVPLTLEDMIDAFFDAHRNWPSLPHTTAAAALLWVTWKTRNRLVFDGVHPTQFEFFAAVRQHLLLWIVRAPRRVDCGPLGRTCTSLF